MILLLILRSSTVSRCWWRWCVLIIGRIWWINIYGTVFGCYYRETVLGIYLGNCYYGYMNYYYWIGCFVYYHEKRRIIWWVIIVKGSRSTFGIRQIFSQFTKGFNTENSECAGDSVREMRENLKDKGFRFDGGGLNI